jgi:hypothetical protein
MYVLMQIYPLEANADDGSDDNCCLDVLAVGSEAELEHYPGRLPVSLSGGVSGLRRLRQYVGRLGSSA